MRYSLTTVQHSLGTPDGFFAKTNKQWTTGWLATKHQPIFWRPKPYDAGQGWQKTEQGFLEPVWACGPILPLSLIDLMETADLEEDEEAEDDIEYEEMLQYLVDDNDDNE